MLLKNPLDDADTYGAQEQPERQSSYYPQNDHLTISDLIRFGGYLSMDGRVCNPGADYGS